MDFNKGKLGGVCEAFLMCYVVRVGVFVQVTGSYSKYGKKLTFTALIAFVGSFFLPFFVFRENRVAPPLSVKLPLPYTFILVIPPLLLVLSLLVSKRRLSTVMLSFSGTLSIILATLILVSSGSMHVQNFLPLGRFSPTSGFYLYIIGAVVIFVMKPHLNLWDYIGFILIALSFIVLVGKESLSHLSLTMEAKNFGPRLTRELFAHVRITLISLLVSGVVGFPLALLSYHHAKFKKGVFLFLNLGQTIPAIALFGLLIAPLAALSHTFPFLRAWGLKGLGNAPAIIALSLYGLYPIIRYSYSAFENLEPSVIDSAKGMGMSSAQIWRIVRLPLTTATILNGVRVALVQTIGNATLAKLIGGDGLGVLVFEGLGQASTDMVLLGMLLIVALTLVADSLFQLLIFFATPKALRSRHG